MGHEEREIEPLRGPALKEWFDSLPGGDWVQEGLADLGAGKRTVAALLVQIGGPRLRSLGLAVPKVFDSPENGMYDLLSQEDSDSAHSRYNALIRALVSFERAVECVNR